MRSRGPTRWIVDGHGDHGYRLLEVRRDFVADIMRRSGGSGCNGNGRRCCADDSSYLHRRRTLSGRLPQRRCVDGHLSQPLSGCREDRVGDSGDDRRGPWFAHPTWRLRILDDVNLDGRRLVHAENLVSIEVGLLHTAVLERDLTIERRSDAEDDRALNLRLDCVGIDDGAAIDRADDPADTNRAILRYFNFGNLRHMGPEDELKGHASPDPFR